jgi:hypothetical protein
VDPPMAQGAWCGLRRDVSAGAVLLLQPAHDARGRVAWDECEGPKAADHDLDAARVAALMLHATLHAPRPGVGAALSRPWRHCR